MHIGILGGGQLGRMLTLAAYPLGIRCRCLDPAADPCAAQVGECMQGEFDDYRALYQFASGLDLVTYEFENVPVESARWLADRLPVWPPTEALAIAQDRVSEKGFFESLGVPVPAFAAVDSESDFERALERIGLPAVLKTTRFGYDGKGQAVLRDRQDADSAWTRLAGRPLILEAFVPFERELSILGVRSRTGEMGFYPLVGNEHRDGMLRRTTAPASSVVLELQSRAELYARRALEALDYAGMLAIELFQLGTELLANEMAPRVHNSGHWTIEGAQTSQFENHLRAIAGLPLGPTEAIGFSEMWNLIGTLPDADDVLRVPGAHLHLYGKKPRPNRKLGHITVCADSPAERDARLRELGEALGQ
jgi:5-(carboxyamino)imidazole ribonucleotide synthase